MTTTQCRVLKAQVGGDYREAYERIHATGQETYSGQRVSIETDAAIGARFGLMGVLCVRSAEAYDAVLPNQVRAMGAGYHGNDLFRGALPMIERFAPTHLILTGGLSSAACIRWGLLHGVKVLPLAVESITPTFQHESLARRLVKRWKNERHRRRLAAALCLPGVRWVGNHNIPSCMALRRWGIPAEKIIPWDWPEIVKPDDYAPKKHPGRGRPWRLVYVGAVREEKGVGDLLRAVELLSTEGRDVSLQVLGSAAPALLETYRAGVRHLGERVAFRGKVPHEAALRTMRDADLMVVPSRHDYPEGLPHTIYEALAVQTPLVCSDHPNFMLRLKHLEMAMVFNERNSAELAACVRRLMDDAPLYEHLSARSAETWLGLQLATKYRDFLGHWISGLPEDEAWLRARSLAAYPEARQASAQKRDRAASIGQAVPAR